MCKIDFSQFSEIRSLLLEKQQSLGKFEGKLRSFGKTLNMWLWLWWFWVMIVISISIWFMLLNVCKVSIFVKATRQWPPFCLSNLWLTVHISGHGRHSDRLYDDVSVKFRTRSLPTIACLFTRTPPPNAKTKAIIYFHYKFVWKISWKKWI